LASNPEPLKDSYATTRYAYTPKRRVVWNEVCRHINRYFVLPIFHVLELGCGYGDFIGNMDAKKKTVVEADDYFTEYIRSYGNEIDLIHGDVRKVLPGLPSEEYDAVVASNFFEHFSINEVEIMLKEIRRILSNNGSIIIIQPNYRFCASKYFDDYTHRTAFSHISFSDLLQVAGFKVSVNIPRFLPFSFKSRFPIFGLLVRLYLSLPFKPMGAQFLIIARKEG
jgi:SAM-dependent methyltransferase